VTIRYAQAILWTLVIFAASTDFFSANHTGSVLQLIATAILGHPLSETTYELLHLAIRKLAHLTEYGILAWLWFRALRGERSSEWTLRWSAIAVLIAIAVAATDEWHQSFVPTRTSSPLDVLIDTCGAVIAQLLVRVRAATPAASARSSSPRAAD
jgi:VanZ family protein